MANRPRVPKFGNWESQENVAYTVFFDKARENRPGATKMINPNDPRENPELFSNQGSPACAPPPPRPKQEPKPEAREHISRRRQDQVKSREEADFKQFPVSPACSEDNRRGGGEPRNQRYGSNIANAMDTKKQPGHKGSYHTSSHGSAEGRTRPVPNARNEQRGAAIPKFGGWDDKSTVAADGYTLIFDKVREEKHQGGRVPGTPSTPSHPINQRPSSPNSSKSCCFPWGRKREY